MPYITDTRRSKLEKRRIGAKSCTNAGELTWALTFEIEDYRDTAGDSFQTFAEIIGALEQAKDEFQRRVIHPYETAKAVENGDVYAKPNSPLQD